MCCAFYIFCFFKQKTAYEMRISDWSSDVCSSDLLRINARGGCQILGRSDSTLNRHGVRIATAEIYRTLATVDELDDSLIVHLDLPGSAFFMPLFVIPKSGVALDPGLQALPRHTLPTPGSPRHVPDAITPHTPIPSTHTHKPPG